MEYLIFRYKRNEMHTKPTEYSKAYYDSSTRIFVYYSCSLVVVDDNKFYLKGPDENLKKYIQKTLEKYNNRMYLLVAAKDENGEITGSIPMLFKLTEKNFSLALNRTVGGLGYSGDYCYATNLLGDENGYRKVNSIEDVKRLDGEYAVVKAKKEKEKKLEEQVELEK